MPAPAMERRDTLNFCVRNERKDGRSVGFQKLHIQLFFPHNFEISLGMADPPR